MFIDILDRKEGLLGNKSVFWTKTENASFSKAVNSSFWSNTVNIRDLRDLVCWYSENMALWAIQMSFWHRIKIGTFPNGSTHDFGQNIGNFFKDYFVFWLK